MMNKRQTILVILLQLGLLGFHQTATANTSEPGHYIPIIVQMILDDTDAGAIAKQIRLAWSAPVQRTDASPLGQTDLANYRLRFRKQGSQRYQFRLLSANSERSTITLRGDAGDQFELSLQAIDNNGSQSDYTPAIVVSFDEPPAP